jgi:hypothetical protein
MEDAIQQNGSQENAFNKMAVSKVTLCKKHSAK